MNPTQQPDQHQIDALIQLLATDPERTDAMLSTLAAHWFATGPQEEFTLKANEVIFELQRFTAAISRLAQ